MQAEEEEIENWRNKITHKAQERWKFVFWTRARTPLKLREIVLSF
jgi:hypothetical protein